MAHYSQPLSATRVLAGGTALALLLVLTLGTVWAVWSKASFQQGLGPADWAAVRFTISQALVSAIISVLIAIPTARALARRQFWGRQLMVSLLGAPFILPGIVAVLGIVAVWGRTGYISTMIGTPLNIYGYTGVILAHVFFNLPLATRFILQGWLSIPSEHFRLASQLGMSTRDVNRTLERPMLREVIPGAFLLIFLLCITSFAVALALGGGPRATTVELAIYQALRFDFNLSKTALLAMVQFVLCTATAIAALWLTTPQSFSFNLDHRPRRWDGNLRQHIAIDTALLILVGLFLFVPLASILLKGVPNLLALPPQVWPALGNSVAIAVTSALLTILLSLALSALIVSLKKRSGWAGGILEAIGFLSLAASPFVIGTGLFIILNPYVDPFSAALPITIVVNAVMSLPFALRVILPAMKRAEQFYGRLGNALGMNGWDRFRIAIWPRLKRPVGFAAGLSAALSMGDLGVITLFAPPDLATLPLTMYRLMSAYQNAAASGVALLMISTSLLLFWLFDKGGRLDHHVS